MVKLKRSLLNILKWLRKDEVRMINIGDKVENKNSKAIGIVIRKFKSGSIGVLEKVAPVVICTHDSEKTLRLVEKNSVTIFDETN